MSKLPSQPALPQVSDLTGIQHGDRLFDRLTGRWYRFSRFDAGHVILIDTRTGLELADPRQPAQVSLT